MPYPQEAKKAPGLGEVIRPIASEGLALADGLFIFRSCPLIFALI